MTIEDAIYQIKEEEIHARRQAESYKSPKSNHFFIKRANDLAQLASWLIDYKQITGKE